MYIKTLLISIMLLSLFSCTESDPSQVSLSGQITNPVSNEISLKVKDSTYTRTLTDSGEFSLEFSLDSASHMYLFHEDKNAQLYVRPGEEISLTVDAEQFNESIRFEGSKTSAFLANKRLVLEKRGVYGGYAYHMNTEEEYKKVMDELRTAFLEDLERIGDTVFVQSELDEFDELSAEYIDYQKSMSAYSMEVREYMYKQKQLIGEYDFYGQIDVLDQEAFEAQLTACMDSLRVFLTKVPDEEYVAKEEVRLQRMKAAMSENKVLRDNMPKEGDMAIDFTYPDTDGKDYSLSSFKGQLVYVDVWATWCGPCKAEIPSLKSLEADYHDKAITFMSVSVDTDKEAWLKMVAEDELGGVQLWADGWSQITKDYAIMGIPRFMLFAADGKVISSDAPRPSSSEIRALLDANL